VALYLVSYDIDDKNKEEYEPLWAKLKELQAAKILYSEWILVDDLGKANAIYGEIAPLTRTNDRLLVQELTKDAAWDKLLISDDDFLTWLEHARG
jgi:hypothetical protein